MTCIDCGRGYRCGENEIHCLLADEGQLPDAEACEDYTDEVFIDTLLAENAWLRKQLAEKEMEAE